MSLLEYNINLMAKVLYEEAGHERHLGEWDVLPDTNEVKQSYLKDAQELVKGDYQAD